MKYNEAISKINNDEITGAINILSNMKGKKETELLFILYSAKGEFERAYKILNENKEVLEKYLDYYENIIKKEYVPIYNKLIDCLSEDNYKIENIEKIFFKLEIICKNIKLYEIMVLFYLKSKKISKAKKYYRILKEMDKSNEYLAKIESYFSKRNTKKYMLLSFFSIFMLVIITLTLTKLNKINARKDKEIKVGITTNGSLEHGRLTIFSSENKVQIYNDDFDITVGENERVDVRNTSGTTTITLENGKTYKTKNPLNFYAKGEYLTLSPVRKGHTSSPRYRGIITIIPRSSSLRVINTLDIEKYLLQVVPSEMPKSFGVEALKVQAVAARTYAVSDILKGKYAKDGFHIKDTVESQVYNNQVENEEATRAIEETAGEIMTYDGVPIDAKYFSTSAGFTSHASNVW